MLSPFTNFLFSMPTEVFLSSQLCLILHIPGALGGDQPGSGGHPPPLWEVADVLGGRQGLSGALSSMVIHQLIRSQLKPAGEIPTGSVGLHYDTPWSHTGMCETKCIHGLLPCWYIDTCDTNVFFSQLQLASHFSCVLHLNGLREILQVGCNFSTTLWQSLINQVLVHFATFKAPYS